MVKVYTAYTRVPALIVQFPPVADEHETVFAIIDALEGVMKTKEIQIDLLYAEGAGGRGIS